MEFLKKHYEKILLSIVLLGLGGAAFWLPIAIKQAEQDSQAGDSVSPKPTVFTNLDITPERLILKSATNPQPLVFSGDHNLFNPVTWKIINGTLTKILLEGPEALTVLTIQPLYLTITFDNAAGTGFNMSVQQQSGKTTKEYAKVNVKPKSGVFLIHEVKGTPEDPTELVLELTDSKETVTVAKGKPFTQIDGYTVDLKYGPDNKTFKKLRINDDLTFAGGTYKIIAITDNEVRVKSNSTGKQTTIKWTGTPKP